MKNKLVLCTLVATVTSQVMANPNVIYGKDNRKEVYEASSAHQLLAQSAATMIQAAKISQIANTSGYSTLEQSSLNDWFIKASGGYGLCEGTRYQNQINPGDCSGFLIAPDLLVTAGHCVGIDNFCRDYKWVFDFKVDEKTQTAGLDVNNDNIYSCKKVLTAGLNSRMGLDFGIVRLDRRVSTRTPLTINTKGNVSEGTSLVVIGSPSGLPLKVADGAKVRENAHKGYFVANLDTFAGNSGSAVFNDKTGVVEGILVRGDEDYLPNREKLCFEAAVCEEDACRGEDVSKMSSIPEVAINETLLAAVSKQDKRTIKKIAELKLSLDFNSTDGKTALHKAVELSKVKSIAELVKHGADINYQDAKGNTPAILAAKMLTKKNKKNLTTLIKAGANLDIKNDEGVSAQDLINLSTVKL